MGYCFNPECDKPHNPRHNRFCCHCGAPLLLGNRFRILGPLGQSHQTLLAIDEHRPSAPLCVVQRFARRSLVSKPIPRENAMAAGAGAGLSSAGNILAGNILAGPNFSNLKQDSREQDSRSAPGQFSPHPSNWGEVTVMDSSLGNWEPSNSSQAHSSQAHSSQTNSSQVSFPASSPQRLQKTGSDSKRWASESLDRLEVLSQHPQLPTLLAVLEQELGSNIGSNKSNGVQQNQAQQNQAQQASAQQYLVLDWIEGMPLNQLLKTQGPLPEARVAAILVKLLSVLEAIHGAQAVHCDIQPNNVLVAGDRLALVNYGSLHFLGQPEKIPLPKPRSLYGDYCAYRAPEARQQGGSFANDLYGVGAIAIHLLTGFIPSELFNLETNAWVWPQYLFKPVGDRLTQIINQLAAQSPQERYGSATQALADLKSQAIGFSRPKGDEEATPASPITSPIASPPSATHSVSPATAQTTTPTPTQATAQATAPTPAPTPTQTSGMPQTEGEIQGYGPPTIDLEAFLKNPRIIQLEDLVLAHVMALEAEADPNQNSEPKNPEPKNSKREPREPQTPEALKVLQAWQRLEQLQQQGAPGGKIASQYLELAHFYRDRVKAGQENLMHLVLAIGSYEQTRGYLTNHSCMWAYVLDELGQMYCRLSKITNRHSLACLHRALLVYRQALDHLNPDTQLRTYGAIHNHLGDTFNAIARRHNPVKNLHQAVLAYQSALRVCKPQDLPERYISLQHKLATTYRSLALHQETNYFSHKAAQAYSEAIRYLEADADPEYSGLLHHGLGTIYLNLATLENSQEFLTWALVPIEPL